VTSYGSQFCMTNALRHARAAPALAMSYISIVLTITYGYFLFEEVIPPPPTFWWNSH
jgi:drug/metabolite transporter (DMT)-like permease